MEFLPLWIIGIMGGLCAEVVYLYQHREKRPPEYLKGIFYWVVTAAVIAIGGLVVYVYEFSKIIEHPLAAFHIGASAPVIVGKLAVKPPKPPLDTD